MRQHRGAGHRRLTRMAAVGAIVIGILGTTATSADAAPNRPAPAGPVVKFTTKNGTIVARATGLPRIIKVCSLSRSHNFLNEPVATISASRKMMKVDEFITTSPTVILSTKPLAIGRYDVRVHCTTGDARTRTFFSKDGSATIGL